MIEGRFYIDDPDYMKATLEITMTVAGWKEVKESINKDRSVPREFEQLLQKIIGTAEAHFNVKVEIS